MATTEVDQVKAGEFLAKAVTDAAGASAAVLSELGDRLGLFRTLADNPPLTASEFAERAGINERYGLEWLRGMRATGYIIYDADAETYDLPPEHAAVLADEAGPLFIAPGFRMFPPVMEHLDEIADAFVNGGGVPQSSYSDHWWENMERFTAGWYEHHLVQEWIPAIPETHAKLESGAIAADIGCGSGRAVIKLAKHFPNSKFVGYDVVPEQIALATANAEKAGVSKNASFAVLEVADGLPEKYDLITTFDALHEAVDPPAVLRAVRQGLQDDGAYLLSEMNCEPHDENITPLHALFYTLSIGYCLTTVMSHGGAALGTCGLPEPELRRYCQDAGFSEVRRLDPSPGVISVASVENILYEIRP
jgi:2-polyprenyl-3-methyl-5-hydroxy-6-metoxy-1,4-benzoquinol methylase